MTLPTEFLLYVAELLERLGIPYHVGGSVASSAHGMYRASADVDFVIDPTADQLEALARDLESEFYVSRAAMAEALARRSTFNAIHDQTSFKIDFFIKGPAPFDAEELRRSIRQVVGAERERTVLLKSPEDTIRENWSGTGVVAKCPNASGRTFSRFSRPCADNSTRLTSTAGRGSWMWPTCSTVPGGKSRTCEDTGRPGSA